MQPPPRSRTPSPARSCCPLRAAEATALRGEPYVIEHFGYGVSAKRTLSLTFDDGPDEINTPKLLDLLSREGVSATFFITGQQAAKHPELMRRIVTEGHALGNHTFSHRDLTTVSSEEFRRELITTDRIIRATTNTYTTMFRPPYGGIDDYSLSHGVTTLLRAQQLGYTTVNYDHDSNDWKHPHDDNISVPALAGDNITMLMHDGAATGRPRSPTSSGSSAAPKRPATPSTPFRRPTPCWPDKPVRSTPASGTP